MLTVREKLIVVLKAAASKRLTGGYVSLLVRNETKVFPFPLIIRISLNKVSFGYQSLFLEISLEMRGRLIIRVVLYSGQYGNYNADIISV